MNCFVKVNKYDAIVFAMTLVGIWRMFFALTVASSFQNLFASLTVKYFYILATVIDITNAYEDIVLTPDAKRSVL